MKTVLLFTLLAVSAAEAQNTLQNLIKQRQREQQAPGSAGYRPPAVEDRRETARNFRRDQPHDWQPPQYPQPGQPQYRPEERPATNGRGSYPGWPVQQPEPPPQFQPPRHSVPDRDLFDPSHDHGKQAQTTQDLVRAARERYERDKEYERYISPGINRPQTKLPIHRPERTQLPEQTYRLWQNYTNNWNQWTIERNGDLNRFARQRSGYWQQIDSFRLSDRCWQDYGRDDWRRWQRDSYYYRTQRCYELWNSSYWFAGQIFDAHWWNYCQFAGRRVPADLPGWWWFQPASWELLVQHLRLRSFDLLPRDPGLDVVYWRDRVYITGQDAGAADRHRRYAIALAAKNWGWEPPIPGGRYDWLPLGVWALTPQEYGDATMMFQLSISREGLITGAFTNVLTGEEQPVLGRADLAQHRAAWRIGRNTSTVIETGLSGFTWDVAGAFVHYASGETQVWQLTRLPMPGAPPGPVRLPGRR